MKERIGEVTVSLVLRTKALASGKYPVYIRVQRGSENRYFSCRCDFTQKEWASFERSPDHDHPAMSAYRKFLEASRALVTHEEFSFQRISEMTRRRNGCPVQDLIREYSTAMRKQNKHNTADMYLNLLSSFDEFAGGAPFPLARFTAEKGREFLRWLEDTKKNGPTTVNMKAKNLSAVLQKAVREHLIPENPMSGVKRPPVRRRIMNVEEGSLARLLNASEEELGPENHRWLQYWRAMYYGNGMNARDLLLLTKESIRADEIVFVRRKTQESNGREIHVPLTPELLDAIGRLSGGKEHILPDLDGFTPFSEQEHKKIKLIVKNINNHVKEACATLGIDEKVTTYAARHTFATRLLRKGVPVEFISDAMGHSRISTTQNYLDGYTSEQRRKRAELLKV